MLIVITSYTYNFKLFIIVNTSNIYHHKKLDDARQHFVTSHDENITFFKIYRIWSKILIGKNQFHAKPSKYYYTVLPKTSNRTKIWICYATFVFQKIRKNYIFDDLLMSAKNFFWKMFLILLVMCLQRLIVIALTYSKQYLGIPQNIYSDIARLYLDISFLFILIIVLAYKNTRSLPGPFSIIRSI